MSKKSRTEEEKAARRIRDKQRRLEGKLVGWSHGRRTLTESGHKSRLLSAARMRAKRKGTPFDIGPEDFGIPKRCPVLGIKLKIREGKSGCADRSPSLDRIICKRGYVPGHVEVISGRANRIKHNATLKELKIIGKYYGKKRRKSSSTKNKKGLAK